MKIKIILFFVIALFLVKSHLNCQPGFSSLSAKERVKIAEQEELLSETDTEYQTIMKDGHELFKQGQYLQAVHKYEIAKDKRPFNVYPKIIITDIELNMKDMLKILREQEREMQLQEKLKKDPAIADRNEKNIKVTDAADEQKKLNDWENSERERLENERDHKSQKPTNLDTKNTGADIPKMSVEDFRQELGKRYPEGITEEIYTEGNKTITKRIVVTNKNGDEYKKVVSNNWGGVFYFKNSVSITERIWNEDTKK